MEHDAFAGEHVLFARSPDFIFRRIVDEAVLIPIHWPVAAMDCFYTLNEVAAFVWQMLDTPATRAKLHRAVLDTYDAAPGVAAEDLSCFLLQMVDIGAIRCLAPRVESGPAQNA